ncbi:S8 family serine peptidase [Pediococcus ethanolidurans]|uniref:S8 family peptidase n=1 Tax=Pediococcus ethanolidurans TaxID=319653 RepID=UPI002955DEC9|nr:S8 family peptidase [Pediococcus ethanolidurans]MDV7720149.1 S8 family serine peptidase [Pediococcus ethanolidurans]
MNDILSLKGHFNQHNNTGRGGTPKLPTERTVTAKHLQSLIDDLNRMYQRWKNNSILDKALIAAYYRKVAAKSNRIQGFFSLHKETAGDSIVGAKFAPGPKHIIIYFVSLNALDYSINVAKSVKKILEDEFGGSVDDITFNDPRTFKKIDFNRKYDISRTKFQQYVVDADYLERFDVEEGDVPGNNDAIVTLYDTGDNVETLLGRVGLKVYSDQLLDKNTVRLDHDSVTLLMSTAPYLIAMATEDLNQLAPSSFTRVDENLRVQIPEPTNEATVGVIDTLFDPSVYFSNWVDYRSMLDSNIDITSKDYKHGTEISSIIVDGPTINPQYDDGCGRFKVRHFGVAPAKGFSSFSVIRSIKKIVAGNSDIHVWNLSLGSEDEINQNFISAEAAVLDQIQFDQNVIFVISGTNRNPDSPIKRIGSPADSINSVVVNSVNASKKPASYSREGIVLSFFTKPDISYYGGDETQALRAVSPLGEEYVEGTSFAAPWITRKLAYMIEVLGLGREVAKALLIDSAIKWDKQPSHRQLALLGNGVVPVRIEDVLHTSEDEIKFVLEGTSEAYDTYTYDIPVPIVANKQPFVAKATLCYFPKCSRNQGVDYTNTELDVYFGRIDNSSHIKSINENVQSDDTPQHLQEIDARRQFRKWDNVKHISEILKVNSRAKKVYDNPMWALSLKTKERLNNRDGSGIHFGVVITLKEINGVNRIEDFIQQASLKGWLVNRISVSNRIQVYEEGQNNIHLE